MGEYDYEFVLKHCSIIDMIADLLTRKTSARITVYNLRAKI